MKDRLLSIVFQIQYLLHSFMQWVQKDMEPINWLSPEETFSDVTAKHIIGVKGGPKEGDQVFLISEHQCDCDYHENYRYIAVVRKNRWVKEKINWRMY